MILRRAASLLPGKMAAMLTIWPRFVWRLLAGEVVFSEIFVTPAGQSKGCG